MRRFFFPVSLLRSAHSVNSCVLGSVCGTGHPSPGSACCLAGGHQAAAEVGPEVASQVTWFSLKALEAVLSNGNRVCATYVIKIFLIATF